MSDSTRQNNKSKRKIIILLLIITIIIILLLLIRCGGKKEMKPAVDEEQTIDTVKKISNETDKTENNTITPELKTLFEDATSGITGIKYEPIELISIQENDDGTDYQFLALGSTETEPDTKQKYYITIHEDLNYDVTLTGVEPFDETKEGNEKTIVVSDGNVESMYYVVVFYDQYGNELQREALKYGTVPQYKGSLPEGFLSWDKTLNPITGNTYYHAICNKEQHTQEEHSTPTNPESDYGFYTNSLYTAQYGSGQQIDAIFTTYVDHNTDLPSNGYRQALVINGSAPNANKASTINYLRCSYEVNTNTNPKTITLYTDPTDHTNNVLTIEIGEPMKLINFPNQGEDVTFAQPEEFRNFFSVNQEEGYAYQGDQMIWLLKKEKTVELTGTSNITKIGKISHRGEYFSRHLDYAENIKIGPSIKEIGTTAFQERNFLENVDFSNATSLQIIGRNAFESCGNEEFKKLEFPASLRIIDSKAFTKCISISELKLNQGLETIGPSAFEECTKLNSVKIPSSVVTIKKDAFKNVPLTSLTFDGTPSIKEIGSFAFRDKDKQISLVIPKSVEILGVGCFGNFDPTKLSTAPGFNTNWILYDGSGGQIDEFNLTETGVLEDFLKGLAGDSNFSKPELFNGEMAYFEIKRQTQPVG